MTNDADCLVALDRFTRYKTYHNEVSNTVNGIFYVENQKSVSLRNQISTSIASSSGYFGTMDAWKVATTPLIERVVDSTGYPVLFRCTVLKEKYDNFYKSMCKHSAPAAFQVASVMFMLSFFQFINAIMGILVVIRHTRRPPPISKCLNH
jgi:hypothetical protein